MEQLTCCQLTDVTSCPTCASPYAFTHRRTQMRVTMVTSIICKSHQKRISAALFFPPPPSPRSKSNLIIPYCFSCPIIKEVAGGGGDLTQLLRYFFLFFARRGEGETRRDGRLLVKMPIDDEARKPNLQS